jgi:hypothetical protein
VIFRAPRRRAEQERGLSSSLGVSAVIERLVSSSASGSLPQAQTGRSGGQMAGGGPAKNQFDAAVLERMEGDRGHAAADDEPVPGHGGSAASMASSSPLTAILNAWKVFAGWPLAEAGRGRHARLDRVDQVGGGPSGRRRMISRVMPPAYFSSPSCRRTCLMRSGPFVDDHRCGQVCQIHAHVQRRPWA